MFRTPLLICSALLLACISSPATAAPESLPELARKAVSPDADIARSSIAGLREAGPAGLEAFLEVHGKAIAARRNSLNTLTGDDRETWDRLSTALNAVGGQYDCHAARLFWYTDLDKARAKAKATGKPILSLRLLGQLTEECSCANSRFFRTVLYANTEVSQVLREQFVLHWKSVRPVPKVTIDFGDGRKLVRTLTGNSIHYILDADGRPVDAIPGLYGPKSFLQHLQVGRQLVKSLADEKAEVRDQILRAHHAQRAKLITRQWAADLQQLGVAVANPQPALAVANANLAAINAAINNGRRQPNRQPNAAAAGQLAVGKGAVEMPLLAKMAFGGMPPMDVQLADALEKATTAEVWNKIAQLHAKDAVLDEASVALMQEHGPSALAAAALAETKRKVENPLLRIVAGFQNSIALDTVRNEYQIHRKIRQWFAAGEVVTGDVEKLNTRVYADLFLTPDSDPWLGLHSGDVYTGLRHDGVKPGNVRTK